MTLETLSEARAHGGTQGVYRHASTSTGTDMTFAVFVPEHEPKARSCRCCGISRGSPAPTPM